MLDRAARRSKVAPMTGVGGIGSRFGPFGPFDDSCPPFPTLHANSRLSRAVSPTNNGTSLPPNPPSRTSGGMSRFTKGISLLAKGMSRTPKGMSPTAKGMSLSVEGMSLSVKGMSLLTRGTARETCRRPVCWAFWRFYPLATTEMAAVDRPGRPLTPKPQPATLNPFNP